MKTFLITCIAFMALLPLCANSQQLPDSLFQKQLLKHKAQLKLSDSQFDDYKKVSKKFLEKMSALSASVNDTSAYISEAATMHRKYILSLQKILNAEQIDLYKKTNAASWQKFKANADENHIKTFANGGDNNN